MPAQIQALIGTTDMRKAWIGRYYGVHCVLGLPLFLRQHKVVYAAMSIKIRKKYKVTGFMHNQTFLNTKHKLDAHIIVNASHIKEIVIWS